MKIKKEQFLLPKAKINESTSNTKWIQPMRKTCEFSKPLTCTSDSSQPIIEGLPSGLVAKINTDVHLPTGDIVLSGHPGGQFIWKQQNGILRQALMNNENDVKSEEKSSESINIECGQNITVVPTVTPSTSLLAITSVPPQQITPIAASQVINVNDYQVILSSDILTAEAWQDKRIKTNSKKMTSLPPIKPKLAPGQMTFTSLGNTNIISQNPNQFPTFVIKDVNSSVKKNVVSGNNLVHPTSAKKSLSKATKSFKVRKKPVQVRKIMLKPTSSLLSQTALDCRSENSTEMQVNNISQSVNLPMEIKPSDLGIDSIMKTISEPITLVSASTSNIILTQNISQPLNSNNDSNSPESNHSNTISILSESSDFSESACHGKSKETNLNSTEDLKLVSCSAAPIEIYSIPVVSEQTVVFNSNEQSENQKSEVDTNKVISSHCTSQSRQNNDATESDSNMQNLIDLTRQEGHIETIILSPDIDHHEECNTQEYTDTLLSQLSKSSAFPNMSSSQVSLVLKGLGSPEKSGVNLLNAAEKSTKEAVKSEPLEFVKIEHSNILNSIKTFKKSSDLKYRICELNKTTCFRCISCMYLSLKVDCMEKHWLDNHKILRSQCPEKQSKKQIKCIGCTNIFYSKYALQIHLLCDHNVMTTEVHDLIAMIFSANKGQSESKRQPALKSTISKTREENAQETEATKIVIINEPSTLTDTPYQSDETNNSTVATESQASEPEQNLLMETSVVLSELAKTTEEKLVSDQQQAIPQTPSFNLFSKVLEIKDKEESSSQSADFTPTENKSKKLLSFKKVNKGLRAHKSTRNKMRIDFASEIKFNYKCVMEKCGVRMSSMDNLSYHFRCHKTDTDMLFCPECDFSVFNWSSLTPHLWREHKIDIDLYSCKHCNYKSNSYSKLINNHIKIHGDERPFLCDICGKGFKTTKQLRNHKVIHRSRRKYSTSNRISGESENIELNSNLPEYTCNICSRSFADSRILKQHTENVHKKARPYLCSFCPHAASSKSSLQMHIRQHTGEKPFSCDECAYVTSDHNSLRRHKMRHSGKRPYQCPHCTYKCIQATTYKSHLKNKHPGLDEGLMFSCPMCTFHTIKKDNFLAHKAEHGLEGNSLT